MIKVSFTVIIRMRSKARANVRIIVIFWLERTNWIKKELRDHWGGQSRVCSFSPIVAKVERKNTVGKIKFRNWFGRIARK